VNKTHRNGAVKDRGSIVYFNTNMYISQIFEGEISIAGALTSLSFLAKNAVRA